MRDQGDPWAAGESESVVSKSDTPSPKRIYRTEAELRLSRMEKKLAKMEPGEERDRAEREFFAALLNHEFPVRDRVKRLVELSQMTDTKRAPVALRAIQEINAATNLTAKEQGDNTAIFVLPPTAAIGLKVVKPNDRERLGDAIDMEALPAGDES